MDKIKLRRYGGSHQPVINSLADLRAAITLPEAMWAVSSCPVAGTRIDAAFMEEMDRDNDQRINIDDVRRAVDWMTEIIGPHDSVVPGPGRLRLDDFSEAGAELKASAALVLENCDAEDRSVITLQQVRNSDVILSKGGRNGDGVLPPSALSDEFASICTDVLQIVDGETDRNGEVGVSVAVLDAFLEQRASVLAWYEEGRALSISDERLAIARDIMDLDQAVRAWFELCRIHVVDPALAQKIHDTGPESAIHPRELSDLKGIWQYKPLAPLGSDTVLRWDRLYPGPDQARLLALRDSGLQQFAASDWQRGITEDARIAATAEATKTQAWKQAEHAGGTTLGEERLRAIDEASLQPLRDLSAADLALANEVTAIRSLERALLFQRDLLPFANNFCSLHDLFAPKQQALFEFGTLFIAGRELHCALRVLDRKNHSKLSPTSGIFVTYIRVENGKRKGEEYALPVTTGSEEGLTVGRRGVFRDIEGELHEAIVTQIVDNPISLREALLAPFARIGNFITKKLQKWSDDIDKDFEKRVDSMVKQDPKKAPPAPPASGGVQNAMLGGSVAFAALGSAFAFVTKQLSSIGAPTILMALLVLCLLIMVPTGILAAIRLHRRNLAGLLEAGGWAVNDRMRLTAELRRIFTRTPKRPSASKILRGDELRRLIAERDPESARMRGQGSIAMTLGTVAVFTSVAASILPYWYPIAVPFTLMAASALLIMAIAWGRKAAILGWLLICSGVTGFLIIWTLNGLFH